MMVVNMIHWKHVSVYHWAQELYKMSLEPVTYALKSLKSVKYRAKQHGDLAQLEEVRIYAEHTHIIVSSIDHLFVLDMHITFFFFSFSLISDWIFFYLNYFLSLAFSQF